MNCRITSVIFHVRAERQADDDHMAAMHPDALLLKGEDKFAVRARVCADDSDGRRFDD